MILTRAARSSRPMKAGAASTGNAFAELGLLRGAVPGKLRRPWRRPARDDDRDAGVRPQSRGRAVLRDGGPRRRPDRGRRLAGAARGIAAGIMAGEAIWALAWAEGRSRYDFNNVTTTARRQGDKLCSERHQGGGDRRAVGRQADRLGAHVGRASAIATASACSWSIAIRPICTCRASRPSMAGAPPKSR